MADDNIVEGGKNPVVTGADHEAGTQLEGGQPAHLEYDIERVEAVYRKLDLRIIPGETQDHP
ncbi:hypothetical protein PC116_g30058 [Phytophthora cactorum]|nr:hypothetical protein PC116_g30058 [Phytophthora cactorum]